MKYSFNCHGHKNITSKHKTTLEFTKDEDLSLKGDCIVGVKADFELPLIKKFIKILNNKKITITITPIIYSIKEINYNDKNNGNKIKNKHNNEIIETISAEINPGFNSDKEIVIRKGDFVDERTFAVKADKAAYDLDDELLEILKDSDTIYKVDIKTID